MGSFLLKRDVVEIRSRGGLGALLFEGLTMLVLLLASSGVTGGLAVFGLVGEAAEEEGEEEELLPLEMSVLAVEDVP